MTIVAPKGAFAMVLLLLSGALVVSCAKKEKPDPVETVKNQIPLIANAINARDLKTLKKMGTDRFNPESFVADVFRHGVRGDVTLEFQRIRFVPGELRLIVRAGFGPNKTGGLKELTITFIGEDDYKMNTYSFVDKVIPPAPRENILHDKSADTATSDPS